MKNYAAPLLLHLSLHTLAAAQGQVPTFNQRAPEEYIGDVTNDGGIGPDDIKLVETEGLEITFGTELSKRVMDVAKAHCENPEDEECKKQMQATLGIGPQNDGLQKRIVGLIIGGVILGYAVYKLLSNIWHRLGESENFKVVNIKMSKEEKEETSNWELATDEFLYKPFEGDPVTVNIDNNQPMVENPPKVVKEANGDITVYLPGIAAAIQEEWSKIIEPRDVKRSLIKRATMAQIVERAQRVVRLAQLGGQGNQIRYISPLDFPKPKTELLIGAMDEDKKYAEKIYLGGSQKPEMRGDIATLATWLAFGDQVGHLTFKDDKMVFPSSFLELQEEIPQGSCPQKNARPFCTNCGGNAAGTNTPDAIIGKCVGLGNGEEKGLQGCECFIDDRSNYHGNTVSEVAEMNSYLRHLPGGEPSGPKEPELKRRQCWKADDNRMKDHHNWKFVQQGPLDEAIKKHCEEWNPGEANAAVKDIDTSSSYYSGDGDWNYVVLSIFQPGGGVPTKEQCHKWMMDISAGCDWDSADLKQNTNQFNWKWGGEVELDNGVKFIIEPQRERIHFDRSDLNIDPWLDDPPENHYCYSLGKFSDHDNKGLNGVELDDKAKMTLQQCVHQLRHMTEDTDFSCGGLANMGFHRDKYDDIKSCAENTWACVSYFAENGEISRGGHNPWFSNCWADFMF